MENDQSLAADAILSVREPEEPLEAWAPEEFDHFTDLGLLRRSSYETDATG
jgi:hypothetical protein